MHICHKNKGSLAVFKDYFEEREIKEIEKRVSIYLSDKGLRELSAEFKDPNEFKRIQDEVIINLKPSNKDVFKVDEAVVLKLDVKNVPELIIKVFEINLQTYYKKNFKKFDSSINLDGMMPSFQKSEVAQFKDVP